MRALPTILFFVSSLACSAQQNQVCFTIDDLPLVNHGITDSAYQKDVFTKILVSLKKNNVPAIGFVNEGKMYSKGKLMPYQVRLLKNWEASGLELGNHTFSHRDYNEVPLRLFAKGIVRGETVTKEILAQHGKQIRYFRHPYLHVGNTKAKADSLNRYLLEHNYLIAPVTIDNEDWVFAQAYTRAKTKKDTALMNKIGRDYIVYMEQKTKYYEKQSNHLFGRNISQVLLLHSNSLNSDYLDSLIAMYKRNNYSFVSLDNALRDPAYETAVTVFGNWGISWIDRWALSEGKKEFLSEDPTTPEYVKKLAE